MRINIETKTKLLSIKLLILLSVILINSCGDTFGTDPFVKKVPIDPIDTSKVDNKLSAKEILWRFKEIAGPNQITEWPNSITFMNNTAHIDTTNGKSFIWLNLEMKANFVAKALDNDKPEWSDRVEYLKIKIDSLELVQFGSHSLNDLAKGRYARIELYSHPSNKKYSFEGSDLITRIKFDFFPDDSKVMGNFIFDFQMIDYIKTRQFIGNFTIYY